MSEPFVDLEAIFNLAFKQTEESMKLGFDISEPCLVTPLEWYANKYPEIAERCNQALLELIERQEKEYPRLVAVGSEIKHEF